MIFGIIWMALGLYFFYLGFEVLVLKNYKKLTALRTEKILNEKAFIIRYGIIQLVTGLTIITTGLIYVIMNNPILFEFIFRGVTVTIRIHTLNIAICILWVIIIVLNEKISKKGE